MLPVVMYSTGHCPYCTAARSLLESKKIPYEDRRLEGRMDLRIEMETRSGRTSVPQIFFGNHHIGGYTDMVVLDRSGDLESLLEMTSNCSG